MITPHDLTAAINELAPPDHPIMLHVSLRSFGARIDGGADALLDAFLARGRTVVVPAFTEPQFNVPAPAALRPARNGIDYADPPSASPLAEDSAYDRGCVLINPHLGAFPANALQRAGVVRGDHPLNSFAALGPLANDLIKMQNPTDVYGPIRQLAEHEGRVLLIGVGLNRMTAIHLAEQESGRNLFLRWARTRDGGVSMFPVGSCSEGFPRLEPVLHQHEHAANVGDSRWRAFPAREAIDAASDAIRRDQAITDCGDKECLLCRDSIAGGPVWGQDAAPVGEPGAR